MNPVVVLDWSHRRHWGDGKALHCRWCGKPALLRDDAGRPAHKTCVERELTKLHMQGNPQGSDAA